MKIFGFHLMPYQGLPQDHLESADSSWVTLSNALFDPALARALYQRYIDELIACPRAAARRSTGPPATGTPTCNSDIGTVSRVFEGVRAAADRYGYSLPPDQLGWALPVFVAGTDAAAEAIALPALDMLLNKLMRMAKNLLFPAGYASSASAARVLAAKGGLGSGNANVRELAERGFAVIGSPGTVRSRLEQYQKELGFGVLCPMFQFGSLGHQDFTASLTLFAQHVMPALRPLGTS